MKVLPDASLTTVGPLFGLRNAVSSSTSGEFTGQDAARRVEREARAIGSGADTTAKGVGNTVVEGGRASSTDRFKAAEPTAKTPWQHVKEGCVQRRECGWGDAGQWDVAVGNRVRGEVRIGSEL